MSPRHLLLALACCVPFGTALVSASSASADATFTCDGNAHVYHLAASGSLAIHYSSGDGNCTMTGSVPTGASLTLDSVSVAVPSGSENDGTITFTGDNGSWATAAGGSFTNKGTILDTVAGYKQALFAADFVNSGTIEASGAVSGLQFDGEAGGTNAGVIVNAAGGKLITDAGSAFHVESPVTLELDANSTATVAPTGTFRIDNSTANFVGGSISGGGQLFAFHSSLVYGGTASSSVGTVRVASDTGLTGTVPAAWSLIIDAADVTLNGNAGNDGTTSFAESNDSIVGDASSTFTNRGVLRDDATSGGQGVYAGRIVNTGTVESAASGANLVFGGSKAGVLENASGGRLIVDAGAILQVNGPVSLALDDGGTTSIAATGKLGVSNGEIAVGGGTMAGSITAFHSAIDFAAGVPAASSGTISATSDSSLSGIIAPGWTLDYSGGVLTAAAGAGNAGTFVFPDYDNAALQATGSFTNSGTITTQFGGVPHIGANPLVNTGTITIPAGHRIAIDGSLSLATSSVLNVGVATASSYGSLQVSGAAALGGTIQVAKDAGYAPAIGDTQNVVTGSPVTGVFVQALGRDATSGFYVIDYTAGAATLRTGAAANTNSPGTSVQATAPTLTALKLSPTSFKAATTGGSIAASKTGGATLSYAASAAGLVTFTVSRAQSGRTSGKSCVAETKKNRKAKACTRQVTVGTFTSEGPAGAVTVHFTGRLKSKPLAAGKYTLSAVLASGGKSSTVAKTGFTIKTK